MIIKREEIVAAIMTEPVLQPGSWLEIPKDERGRYMLNAPKNTPCPACAVGAVMRRVLPVEATLSDIADAASSSTWYGSESGYSDIKEEIEAGRWMNVLSVFFEAEALRQNSRHDDWSPEFMEAVRTNTAEFVRANFPEEIEVAV
jgi:hypothetical protein